MTVVWIALGIWILLWVIVNLPRSRPDGTLVTKLHPYRKMLSFVMPGRNESVVYYDSYVAADPLLDYIARMRQRYQVDVTHCLVNAVAIGLRENPRMNQFVVGQRLYARNHIAVTFSMKRKRMNKEAKVSAVKLFIADDERFEGICRRINDQIAVERSDQRTHTDKELGFFASLPRPLMRWAMSLTRWADYHNLVPASFIKHDGFYSSVFVANLGSLGMAPGYHHLYEYGTCPLFMMVGKVEERPVVEAGQVVARRMLHIRWSYDERIDDGLTAAAGIQTVCRVLESPERYFGDAPELHVEGDDTERGASSEASQRDADATEIDHGQPRDS